MLESDSSLRSGLRRCLAPGASAHSHPSSASSVPLWASASEIEVIDLTNKDEDFLLYDTGTDAESFVPSSPLLITRLVKTASSCGLWIPLNYA